MFPIRDENPTHRLPIVTIGLIIINVLITLHELSLTEPGMERFIYHFGAVPNWIFSGQGLGPVTLITSMFLHGGLVHLLSNMWFLWIFGDNIEDFLGRFRYLIFYLFVGVLAALSHVMMDPRSEIPMVGASGAISGVLGAYMVLHPTIRIRTLVTLGFYWTTASIPAVFFLGIWFFLQITGVFVPAGEVAYGAHLGGFIAGAALMWLGTKRVAARRYRFESGREVRW